MGAAVLLGAVGLSVIGSVAPAIASADPWQPGTGPALARYVRGPRKPGLELLAPVACTSALTDPPTAHSAPFPRRKAKKRNGILTRTPTAPTELETKAMKIPAILTVSIASAAAAVGFAAGAQADAVYRFQSLSGNIYCDLGNGGVACDISDFTYVPPPPPPCGQHLAWGSRFTLNQGKAPAMECHGDTLRVPGEQTLNYGQTLSAGAITCDSEAAGMTCTDTSTGHFFRVSRESYQLG